MFAPRIIDLRCEYNNRKVIMKKDPVALQSVFNSSILTISNAPWLYKWNPSHVNDHFIVRQERKKKRRRGGCLDILTIRDHVRI